MKIEIRKPLCFTEIGRKDQQEDSLYPRLGDADAENQYFLVCDGVGGSEHGEVASATVSQTIGEYLSQVDLPDGVLTEEIFAAALEQAYNALDYAESQQAPSFKKMATTLTFLGIHRRGCLIAHIGDSRVYHVRPGVGILSRTNDHSLVNDLIKAGELTPEQAKTFKQKNIITRAMQPLMEVRDKAEITPVLQVEAGDYFFLCCDGVLEHLQDEDLVNILSNSVWTDDEKLAAIKRICDEGNTRDNYTSYLVPIDNVVPEPLFDATTAEEEVEGEVEHEPVIVPASPVQASSCSSEVDLHDPPHNDQQIATPVTQGTSQHQNSTNKYLWYIVVVLLLALAACVGFIAFGGEKEETPENAAPVQEAPTNLAPPRTNRPVVTPPTTVQEVVTEPANANNKNKPRVQLQGKQNGKPSSPGISLRPNTSGNTPTAPNDSPSDVGSNQKDKINNNINQGAGTATSGANSGNGSSSGAGGASTGEGSSGGVKV